MRRYDEPVQVRLAPGDEAPDAFVWSGRLYRVTQIIDVWAERQQWWREPALSLAQAAAGRQIWRVQATRGRLAPAGIYDLATGNRTVPDGWTLLRSID